MSANSQILNIINDIENLKEETTTLNNNVDTINDNIQTLEDTKQNNITVLDTIQISKLKTQYITMTLTGQDLQSTLGTMNNNTTDLSGTVGNLIGTVGNLIGTVDTMNEYAINLSGTVDTKQAQITDQTDITSRDIVADNITLRPPDIANFDLNKGSIMCSTITTGTLSALLNISALQSIKIGTVDVGSKLISLEGRISSNTSNISSNTSAISGVAASVASLNSTVYGVGIFPFVTPGLVSVVAINTTSIAGVSTAIGIANGRIDDNDNNISSLNSNKQNKLTAQTDIISRDIICDNINLNLPDIDGVDIDKGSITATKIIVNGVNISDKLTNFEGRISSNTSGISSNTSGISSLYSALNKKQDILTAGDNVTIDIITDVTGITSNIISAIGEITQAELATALDTKQDILSAGNNVTIDVITDENGITTNTISSIGEITIEDLDLKQDFLTFDNDLILNSIIVQPKVTQGNIYTEPIDGEIRASILRIEDPFSGEILNVQDTLELKQDKLTAGTNITIDSNNIISSSGGITQSQLDTKQNVLTAGNNITISNNTISSSGGITQSQLDTKQNVLTAGNNITISNNTISATSGTDLNASSDITTGSITCGNITGRTGTTITAPTITASGNLFYGSTNVATKISAIESSLLEKQPSLTTSTNLNIGSITCGNITGRTSSTNITGGTITASGNLFYGSTNVGAKILSIESSLIGKQEFINDYDLSISKTSGLQDALDLKQPTITNSSLSMANTDGLSEELININISLGLKQDKLSPSTNLAINKVSTLSDISAGGNLSYFNNGSKNVKTEFASTNAAINLKQDKITFLTDLTCASLACSDLTVTGDVTGSQFDTIVIRRPTSVSEFTSSYIIDLREIQVWVNNINVLQQLGSFNVTTLTSMFALWSSKTVNQGYLSTYSPDKIYNNSIETAVGAHSKEPSSDPRLALIIRGVPLNFINSIQSIVLYNRVDNTWYLRAVGLAIELYNSTLDPDLTNPLATTNVISSLSLRYRFDFPSISTYTLGYTTSESTTQITSTAVIETATVYDAYNTLDLTSNVKISGMIKTTDISMTGTLLKPNQIFFSASRTASTAINAVGYVIYNQINTNIGGCYETKMGMITATIAGVYYISFGFFTSENKAFTVDLRKNNTEIVNRCKRLDVGTGRFTKFELTTLVYMEVGDFLHIRVESGTAYLESLKQTCIFGYLLG